MRLNYLAMICEKSVICTNFAIFHWTFDERVSKLKRHILTHYFRRRFIQFSMKIDIPFDNGMKLAHLQMLLNANELTQSDQEVEIMWIL